MNLRNMLLIALGFNDNDINILNSDPLIHEKDIRDIVMNLHARALHAEGILSKIEGLVEKYKKRSWLWWF